MLKKYKITIFINKKKYKYKFNNIGDLYLKLKEYYYFVFNNGNKYLFSTSDNNVIINNLIKCLKMYCDLVNWCNYDKYFKSDKYKSQKETKLYNLNINKGDNIYLKLNNSWFGKEKLKFELKNNIELLINEDILRNIKREMNFNSLLLNINEDKLYQLKYIIKELDKITSNRYNYSKIL